MKTKERILEETDAYLYHQLRVDVGKLNFVLNAMEIYANQSKWISVETELPKPETVVLISKITGGGGPLRLRTLATVDADGRWWRGKDQLFDVTHWQPLPANP